MILVPDDPRYSGEHYDTAPDIPDPVCPVCGNQSPSYIYIQGGEVLGCDKCIETLDASEWAEDQFSQEREAEIERLEELNRHD